MKTFLVLFLALWIPGSRAEPADILAPLRKEHPRLLVTGADFETLKKRVSVEGSEAARWWTSIRKEADAMLTQPPSEYVIPDGKRLLATSRRVRDRTLTLGLAFKLSGEVRYAERLWRELDAAAHFKDWNPPHFLDTAEMTGAFALGYDWLFSQWTPDQRTELREAIVKMGLNQALPFYRADKGWVKVPHNWNQVCNGGITLGALSIAEEQPAIAAEIVRGALQSVPRAMKHFAPDGAWGEGPGYWDYATDYNVQLIAALESALGSDFGLSKTEGFSKTAEFPIHLTGPLGRTFNYADAGDGGSGGAQMLWMATKFENPAVAAWRIRRADRKPTPLDLIWGAAWLEKKPAMGTFPTARYFRESEIVTMRSAWDDPNATFLGFKAGDNKINHGHLDLGSFVMDAAGQRWVIDLGSEDYNLPGYFGPRRWDYYRTRAEGHNTLIIAPDAAPDQDPRAETRMVKFEATPGAAFAIADLDAAYAKSASAVRRGVALKGRDVLVQDEIRTLKPADVYWFLHTGAEILCEGNKATLSQGGAHLTATILSPADAVFEAMAAEPLSSSPHPEKQQLKHTVVKEPKKLAIHLKATSEARIVVLLSPAEAPAAPAPVVPLAQWK